MKTIKQLLVVIIFVMTSVIFFSCRKDATAPPVKLFSFGTRITIDSLRNAYHGVNIKITSNTTLYGVVTADETSGQLYKQVYIRDHSGTFAQTKNYAAISCHFLNSTNGALTQGDSIAINLNGIWLDISTGGSLQLDSIPHATYPVIKVLASGLNPAPIPVTIPQLNAFASGHFIYDAQLVQLNNVEFIGPNLNTTFATPQSYSVNVTSVPPVNVNKYVCDQRGNTIVAYNSGYSNFAGQTIPNNSGSITAVANLYTTMQLSIRSYPDMSWTSPYIPIVYDTITQYFGAVANIPINYSHTLTNVGLSKNSSCANMAGWQTFDLQGNLFWQGAQYGSYPDFAYAPSVSNYKTTTPRNDIWLVSPPIVDAATYGAGYTKRMDFSSALTYGPTSGNKVLLSVLVCRTFNGTIIPSQWTDISHASNTPFHNINNSVGAANSFAYAHNTALSGNPFAPTLAQFTLAGSSPTFYVAFRYQSNTASPYDSTAATYNLGALILKN